MHALRFCLDVFAMPVGEWPQEVCEVDVDERVEKLLPATPEHRAAMEAEIVGAKQTYAEVFEGRPLREMFLLQAGAERQGAAAWRLYASQTDDPALKRELERCAELEEESSAHLEQLLGLEIGSTAPADS